MRSYKPPIEFSLNFIIAFFSTLSLSCVEVVDCAFILFLLAFFRDGEIISNYRESR